MYMRVIFPRAKRQWQHENKEEMEMMFTKIVEPQLFVDEEASKRELNKNI